MHIREHLSSSVHIAQSRYKSTTKEELKATNRSETTYPPVVMGAMQRDAHVPKKRSALSLSASAGVGGTLSPSALSGSPGIS